MRRARALAMAVVAAAAVVPLTLTAAAPAPASGTVDFSTQSLGNPVYFGADTGPSIKIGRDGAVYISAVRGTPNGMDLWRADHPGGPVAYVAAADTLLPTHGTCCATLGGQDVDIEVDDSGVVGIADNWTGSVTVGASTDRGHSFLIQPLGALVPLDDREWLSSDGSTFYLNMRDLATGDIVVERSVPGAGGMVYVPTSPGIVGTAADPSITDLQHGNLVADRHHKGLLYQVYTSNTDSPAQGTMAVGTVSSHQNIITMAVSHDGGVTWTRSTVFRGVAGSSYAALFPTAAVDREGNVFIAVSDRHNVLVFASHDQGATWSAPVRVNGGQGAAVLPWIAATGDGGVVVTWFGATTDDPNANENLWRVYAAETVDGLAAAPTYRTFTVSNHYVHAGSICAGPVGSKGPCQGGGRNLGDYFQVAIDPEGVANVAWADDSAGQPSVIKYARGGLHLGEPN